MKKIILILLFFLFSNTSYSEMKQKTQGNLNNLPANISSNPPPPPPPPPPGPTPDSGPLTSVYPQLAYFNWSASSSQADHALAQAQCETLGPGWGLPTIDQTTPTQVVPMIRDNFSPYSFYYHSSGISQISGDGTTIGANYYFYMSASIQKILCYHP